MKSPLKTIGMIAAVGTAIAASTGAFVLGGIWSAMALLALSVLAALVLGTVCTPENTESIFDRHKKCAILSATVTGCVLVIACCLAPFSAHLVDALETRFAGADLFSYYTAQLSLTFISISVMSVLSDKSVIIYWANVSEDRLIRPTFYCFAAYTYYSIGATIGAGLGVVLNHPLMFVSFFAINVAVMILLTLSMIDVYYGRDIKKRKLAKTLNPYTSGRDVYEGKILGLEQNLLKAADDKDVVFLREIYELCIAYPGKFGTDIGREAIEVMVSTLNGQTTGSFLRALDQSICEQLKLFSEENNQKAQEYAPVLFDNDIWSALCSERAGLFSEQIAVTAEGYSSPNAMLFAKVVMRRLTLEYNSYAARFLADQQRNGKDVHPEQYFVADNLVNSIYEPKTVDGMPISTERFQEVIAYIRQTFHYNTMLFASLIRLMDLVMKDGRNWYTVKQFSALPFAEQWANDQEDVYDTAAVARLMAIFQTENT